MSSYVVTRITSACRASACDPKRPGAEINAIQPEDIERVVTWFASMCHQIEEVRTAFRIQHHDLAVQNRPLSLQAAQNFLGFFFAPKITF
jgi:hypothetical protein